MIKSITKESYSEEKNIINYMLGIKTIDFDEKIKPDHKNIIEEITKYSLKNCSEFIKPKFVATFWAMPERIDCDFLIIQYYSIGKISDDQLYLFYSIFYNHAIISAYYTATHLNSKTESLNSIFKSMYHEEENSYKYKQYKAFFKKKEKSYISSLIDNMSYFSDANEQIFSSYANIVINSIRNESHFHTKKMNRFNNEPTWTKMNNLNNSLLSFGNYYFFDSNYLSGRRDCEYIQSLYEFERYYNIDYLQFIIENYTHILNQDFHFNQKSELFNRLCYLGSLLPNIYSRKCVMANLLSCRNTEAFDTSEDNPNILAVKRVDKSDDKKSVEWLERAKRFLLHLIYIAFPLVEKTVFINLYEYFKLSEDNHEKIISLMEKHLAEYINDNPEIISCDFRWNAKSKENKNKIDKNLRQLAENYKAEKEIFDINPIICRIKKVLDSDREKQEERYSIFENVFSSDLFRNNIDKAQKMELTLFYRDLIDLIYTFDKDVKYDRKFSIEYFSHSKIAHDFQKLIVNAFMDKNLLPNK